MKMIHQTSLQINQSASTIFAVLSFPGHFPAFIPAIKRATWVDESPLQIGKAYLEMREAMGSSAIAKVRVSKYEPPYRIAYKSTAMGITGEYIYTLKEENGQTMITFESWAGASGLANLLLPLFVKAMKKDSTQLQLLKKYVEDD